MMKKNFRKVWLGLFLAVAVSLVFKTAVFGKNTPSLEQVLKNPKTAPAVDLSIFVTALLALSLATISVAKGYEVLKRNQKHDIAAALLEDKNKAKDDAEKKYFEEKIEELNFTADNLGRELQEIVEKQIHAKKENEALRNQLKKSAMEISDMQKIENMLRKSNVELSRECDRLKSNLKPKTRKKAARPRLKKKK